MSGVAENELALTRPARSRLDGETLVRLAPDLERGISCYLSGSTVIAGRKPRLKLAVLNDLLKRLLETDITPEDQRRYLTFAAPLVRRVVLTCALANAPAGNPRQMELWLQRLEAFDPLAALMVDLHYFAGLSVRETAGVLGVSRQTVTCDLRFARAWLKTYLGRALAKRT
jgi:hypothetical protein